MQYIFGPVLSRRLGRSLGVDIVPFKTCTLDCVYCECGRTTRKTVQRRPWVETGPVFEELKAALGSSPPPDYITITGSGEPTLNSGIGDLIRRIKSFTDIPVAVLTNGTLLFREDVREDILKADVVVPSLDGVCTEDIEKIDRPHGSLDIETIIHGLVTFREEYSGKIWLEVFFVKDLNDSENQVDRLIEVIKRIHPDKVQLNTVDRPPAEKNIFPVSREAMHRISQKMKQASLPVEEISLPSGKQGAEENPDNETVKQRIIELIRRRPETASRMADTFSVPLNYINKLLRDLDREGEIEPVQTGGEKPHYRIKQ